MLSQIIYLATDTFSPYYNPVAIVKMDNLAIYYATLNYAVINGKIYVMYTNGWGLVAEQASIHPSLSTIPVGGSLWRHFPMSVTPISVTAIIASPPVAEYLNTCITFYCPMNWKYDSCRG